MSSDFCKQVLKVIVAQTCQNMGWNAIHSTPLDILIDILHRYLQELSRTTHRYCEQFGRTEPNLDDLGLSFQDLGISLIELEEYMNSVDPIKLPFDVPKFPLPRKNQILHQQPDSDEKSVTADADISDEAVENVTDDDFTEKGPSLLHQVVSGDEVETQNDEENLTLKRCLPDTTSTPPPASKRLRAMTEEELSNSARDLTSVFMTSGGVISPAREGKLPDAKTPHYTVPVARPDTPDGAKLTPENSENTKEPPKEVKEPAKTEIGEDSVEKVEIPPKKNGRKNKPPCKPKKLTFVKQNSSSDKINLKISSGDAVKNNIDDSEKVSDDKPKKKTPSKNSKSSKKSASKSDKTQLAGIVPLRAEESKVGKVSGTDDQVTKFDDMDDSSKALKHHASDKKKSAEEKTSYENSLDDTIENVIQKAMQSESNMSDDEMIVKYRGRKLKTKDVYDFTDSGGEGSEPRTPKTPDVVASKAMKEKLEDISPSLTSKLEGSPKTSKKKSKEKSTKSSSKKDSNVESKSESAIDSSFLFAEEPVMTSPFHNPPGFPSRPPLPLLPGFHAGLHPSFTTNLGPPPPAHQGVTASNHPSMLPSSPFYPSFPPMMQNLSQFAEMPFSGMGMIPPFASSHFPGMLPTFAHNPRDFYASGNDIQANSISAGVADKNPLTFDKKVSQNTQGPTSSSPQKLSTSPVQVLSIKSEPNCAIQTSKIEIKSSLLGSVVGESSSFGSSKVKAEKSEKTKNKEHKKDKKDKTEKKEKVKKKEKKEKIKEDLSEIPEMKPEKKDKSKSKDKKKSKHKDEEVKEEPLQKITLKLASSKIIIKSVSSPSTPAVEEKKMPSPRPEPVPPSPPPPLDLNIKPDLPPIVTKAAVKLSPPIKSPSARGRKKGRPCKNPTPKKKAVEPVTMLEPEPEELPSMSLITETVGTTLDEDGNKIWICPKCGRPDDGSAMIGCDSCDDWYHWVCVKIVVPPKEEDSWFCTRCISKQHQQLSSRKKKKKHRKEK